MEPRFMKIHFKTVSDIIWFKGGTQKCCIQIKIYRLCRTMNINYKTMNINGHFSI